MIHWLWLSLLIPVIIHLVHRRRAKPMPFSTLFFLKMIDQRVARRQKLRELLLLALRILVLAALIGALERPMLRSSTFKGTSVPTTVAIILDNTASMQAIGKDGSTAAFAQAQAAAVQILDGLKNEDSAALILCDAPEEVAATPTTAIAELRGRISRMACGYGGSDLSGPFRRALQCLQQNSNLAREIYILTDMQKTAWTPALRDAANECPKDIPVFLVDVGADVAKNLTLKEVNCGLKVNVVGAKCRIQVAVENQSASAAKAAGHLFIGEEKGAVAQGEVAVAPGASQTLSLEYTFDKPGVFGGRVELTPHDDQPADDVRYFTAHVLERLPVLVVNGNPSLIKYKDGTFFLRLAMSAGVGRRLSPIEAQVVTDRELETIQKFSDYSCVVLADVARVEAAVARRLKEYVQSGGGLLIFCGEHTDPAAYNVAFGPPDGLLPARLGALKKVGEKDDGAYRVTRLDASHPIFDMQTANADDARVDFSTARVRGFFSTEIGESEKSTLALMELDDGPLLLQRRVGAGNVILCTSTCTTEWNNLPLKPYFLPLVHQMVYYLGRSASDNPSTPVGLAYHLKVAQTLDPVEVKFAIPERQGPSTIKMVKSALRQGENRATLGGIALPGIYAADWTVAGNSIRQCFAVNYADGESNLVRLSPESSRDELLVRNLVIVKEPERLASVVRVERQGVPLWDYLLMATIVLAVCECFVGNMFLKH